MSKTYKKYPDHYLRQPRGVRQALRAKARDSEVKFRTGSIPPSSWDDNQMDDQVWAPEVAAEKMVKVGMDKDVIIQKIRRKFNLTQRQAEEVIKYRIGYDIYPY